MCPRQSTAPAGTGAAGRLGNRAKMRHLYSNAASSSTSRGGSIGAHELLDAALAYAARGWPVFPCKPRGKEPLTPHGFKDATTDEVVIRDWWSRWPDANIGIPTGASTFVVLDVDTRDGGNETLRELVAQHGELPETPAVLTSGGGTHYYLAPDGVRCCKVGKGIDLKGAGGYVIAPPSVHPTGWTYTWDAEDVPMAAVPGWLAALARPGDHERGDGHGRQHRPPVSVLSELPQAAEALKRLAPERCDDYDSWLRVGMALTELGDAGLALWDEWSQQSAKYEPGACAEKWATLEPGQGITLASLYHWAAEDQAAKAGAQKPVIKIRRGILDELATSGEDALIRGRAPIYARGDLLQRPVVDEVDAADGRKTQVVRLATLSPEALVDHLSRVAVWQKYDARSKAWLPADPPLMVARIILSRTGGWQLPKIAGVITTPTIRPDGSLLTQPGYDPATRLLLVSPPEMPAIPTNPSRADAERALRTLDDLLREFPFADDVSRSVALSALITPVVRPTLGQVPMHTFTSPEQGTGKSYLVDLCAAIATGRWCPVIAAGDCDRAELEKRLGAAAISATSLLSLDNVNGVLASSLLCQLIERPLVDIRFLGQSRNITIETRMTVFATGNNLAVSGDLVRRTIQCRMDAQTERPETRTFANDPYRTIVSDRGRYIAAVLTIVRAYIVAGLPGRLQPLPSFARWSDYVRSALVWLGCADPVSSIEIVRGEDPLRAELTAVIGAWAAAGLDEPLTAAQLVEAAAHNQPLAEALAAVASRRGAIDNRQLGYWLRGQRGRIVDGWRIDLAGNTARGRKWQLVRTDG